MYMIFHVVIADKGISLSSKYCCYWSVGCYYLCMTYCMYMIFHGHMYLRTCDTAYVHSVIIFKQRKYLDTTDTHLCRTKTAIHAHVYEYCIARVFEV